MHPALRRRNHTLLTDNAIHKKDLSREIPRAEASFHINLSGTSHRFCGSRIRGHHHECKKVQNTNLKVLNFSFFNEGSGNNKKFPSKMDFVSILQHRE